MNNTNNHDLNITAFSTDQAQIPPTFLWNYFLKKMWLSLSKADYVQAERRERILLD